MLHNKIIIFSGCFRFTLWKKYKCKVEIIGIAVYIKYRSTVSFEFSIIYFLIYK